MCILIGADTVPTRSNMDAFTRGELHCLVDEELAEILSQASFRIFNMEVPLSNKQQPINKYGPSLIAPVSCINGYRALGADLVTLANNHIMDQNIQGFHSTIQALNNANIAYVGAGKDICDATKPYTFIINEKKYGVYACAEHEFSIADENKPGANPFDPLESLDHVSILKTNCDFVIVLYHGGKECYRYPSPELQKTCRKLVEKGADLVICQHSHCIGCKEQYLQGTIVYGQGNFLFDYDNLSDEYWETSILVKIENTGVVDYVPLSKRGSKVQLANENEAKEIIRLFNKRSEDIKQTGFIQKQYDAFAKEYITNYMLFLAGKEKDYLFRVINKLSGHRIQRLYAEHYKKRVCNGLRNYIECEAHRELLLKGLEIDA